MGIRVRTVRHARIRVVAHYRTISHAKRARASVQGLRMVWYWTSGATLGYRVQVTVRVSRKGRKGWCSTWFTPRALRLGRPGAVAIAHSHEHAVP